VFGGAGFIGSHIVEELASRGEAVTVVDGLLPRTGGARRHLAAVEHRLTFSAKQIEEVDDLVELVGSSDVVVDCMAWTRHLAALEDPAYDMRLNLASHLTLLAALRRAPRPLVVYLASLSQYGSAAATAITEQTPMVPTDVQAIHKVAADHHFRLAAALHGLNVISLRVPNCFGERQPLEGDDIGLIGGFIRTLLAGNDVMVYGAGRRRSIVYVRDLAALIVRLCDCRPRGFTPLNLAGERVSVAELAATLASLVGCGAVREADMPHEVGVIDQAGGDVSEDRLRALVGDPPRTDLRAALATTVEYFREHSRDLAV